MIFENCIANIFSVLYNEIEITNKGVVCDMVSFDLAKFKEDRKKLMTAEELANRLGWPVTTIQNIDGGRRKSTTE